MPNKIKLQDAVSEESLQTYFTATGREPAFAKTPWQDAMHTAIQLFIEQTVLTNTIIDPEHVKDTPQRYVKALQSMTRGCGEDPRVHLTKTFPNGHFDEMVCVRNIRLVSLCAHHLLPIFGKVDFAYIPKGQIVGLSKIPRFIQCLAHRPQVQEKLADDIVDIFQEVVQSEGCGVSIRAYHGCLIFRGVEEPNSITATNALRGNFKESKVKSEFLDAIDKESVFP